MPAGHNYFVKSIQTPLTLTEIATLNQAILDNNVSYPAGTVVLLSSTGTDNGTLYRLKGVGQAAQFVVDGGGTGGTPYTDAQALAAARAGIPASGLTAAQVTQEQADGVPSAFTSRTLVQADSRSLQTLSAAQTATVPTGLNPGFGVQFQGTGVLTVTPASGVTILDQRQSGVTPFFAALINTGTNTYILRGDKS